MSLLDPKNDDEELDEPDEKWYAVIIYDDSSGIWHVSDWPTEEEAMETLRDLVYDSIGGHEEHDEDDAYWHRIDEAYKHWSLDEMNEYLEGAHGENIIFCKKGGTE